MRLRLSVLVMLVSTVPVAASAQDPTPSNAGSGAANAIAVRAAVPPSIDGRPDDPVWASAPVHSDFQQYEPDDSAPPSQVTEFRAAYDDRNLYLYVRARDENPDSIMRALSRRDVRGPSDQIAVTIDSYNDHRTAFEFAVNADGVKRDFALFNDENRDSSWDAIWDVATVVDGEGWAAEFRIPLSQLRYPDAPTHVFGLGVIRDIERHKERVSWPAMDRDATGFVSKLGTLTGLVGLSSSRSWEFTPYTVAKAETGPSVSPSGRNDGSLALGGDLKFHITPNVTLTGTINPDFGQVEADPAVLNLTAFETFLSERRPFFVEGTGLYQFRLNCYIVVDCNTNEGLFYSRRIGRAPQLGSIHGDDFSPATTPIAAATKLTGRTGGGLSFGFLDAVTQPVDALDGSTIEPRTNYAVLTAEQDFRQGDAGARLTATAVNRAMDDWSNPYLHSAAYVAGLSVRNRMFEGNYEVAAMLAGSRVVGSTEAIDRTQRNAVHYFQQPGDEVEVDPDRTGLSGYSAQVKFGKYGGGITRFETSLVRHSAGFDPNDLGYLRRADQQDWSTWASLRFNTPTPVYRWFQVNGNHWQTWNTSGLRLQGAVNANAHMGLHNNWDVHAGATLDGLWGSFCDRCTRGGPPLRSSRGLFPWFGFNGDNRRTLVPSMWVNLGYSDEGRSRDVSLNPGLEIRLSTALQARLGGRWSRNHDDAQWYENIVDDSGETHHTFARLEQRTLSLTLRLNYTATPDLTFEFYGEPFISTGTYSDFRAVSTTPDAERYEDRFVPHDPGDTANAGFTHRQLRTNAVVRWEYLPGSTLFVVWAHGRERAGEAPSLRPWRDEYRELFDLEPENTFLVKLAYWFGR